MNYGKTPERIAHNQAAGLLGVGVHTLQAWLRREQAPCPTSGPETGSSFPHFLLLHWMEEETQRNGKTR